MAQATIGALRVNLSLDSAQFAQGLQQAQGRMAAFGKQMQVIGAAVTAVGTGVALAIRGQLNAADELAKASARIGVPVEALSQLQFAAELSAVSMSQLEVGLRGLSRNMVDNAEGFAAIGIALRDAEGVMRPTEAVLADLADVLAGMPEGAERTALAMELMGRSGGDMLPLLVGGADALRAMMQEAGALGLTISQDLAIAAQQFNDNLTRLQRTVTGIWRQMSAQLAPVLEQISEALIAVASVFRDLSPEAQRFLGVMGGLTVVLGPILVAAGLLVTAMSALSAPVLAVVAGLAALTAATVALWPHLVDLKDRGLDAVNTLVDGFWAFKESAEMAVVGAVEAIRAKFLEWVEWVRGLPAMFIQIGRDIIDGLIVGIREKIGELRDVMVQLARDAIPNWMRGPLGIESPSRVFREIGANLMQGLQIGIEDNIAGPADAMAGVADTMSSSFESAFADIVAGTAKPRDAIRALADDLRKMFAQRAARALFGDGGVLSGIFDGFRADGGPVSAGRAYVVGERGPELFVPRGNGQIVPNGAGGTVTISLAPGLVAQMQGDMRGIAVQTVQDGLAAYDRLVAPATAARIAADPGRIG
jgi:phage-related protein